MTQNPTIPPSINAVMKFMLRSPLHGMISKTVLLITFTGRKSGKFFTTPVSYSQAGDRLTIFTHSTWWKNLKKDAPVTLRLRGRETQGLPETIVDDQQAITAGLATHLRQVPSDARYYQVTFDENGNPRPDEIVKAVQSVVMIRIQLC